MSTESYYCQWEECANCDGRLDEDQPEALAGEEYCRCECHNKRRDNSPEAMTTPAKPEFPKPAKELCHDCKEHQATDNFTEGGTLDFIHGFYIRLCRCCILKRQEEFHTKAAKNIAEMRESVRTNPCQ